ncbi:sporulation-specific diadenylate cyclase CdaS [Paenibacillus naphthalenovorans]|nr:MULTISPECIES: sporulation-specific diadenylate cyclase CdaS [Paenibacillus]
MMEKDCDFSSLKLELKEKIQTLIGKMQQTLNGLDEEETCILNEFGQIGGEINRIESLAASFYLKCYISSYTDKYSEISYSVRNLSQRRHGALIVIQREDALERLITPGVSIDANLTCSLLESVFVPGGPLHDGAVLVQGNKIASAANVLPLTNLVTDRKLGTRHRAALGLTERSDAFVIVVSEETGKASFSIEGNMYAFATESLD